MSLELDIQNCLMMFLYFMYGGSTYSRVHSDCCVMFSSEHGGLARYDSIILDNFLTFDVNWVR